MATHQSSSQALSHPSLRWFRCIGFTQIALTVSPRRNATLLVAQHCRLCQLARALTWLTTARRFTVPWLFLTSSYSYVDIRSPSGRRNFILLEVLLKPGSPYSYGGTPKARQPLLSCLLLSDYRWNLMLLCHALTCIQVELSPPFVWCGFL